MTYSHRNEPLIPSSAWSKLNTTTVELVFAVTLLIATGSLVAFSTGDPELIALFAFAGLAVLFLGVAMVRLSGYLKINGIPIIE